MNGQIIELVMELSMSENDLKIANDTIQRLYEEKENNVPYNYFALLKENNELKITHELNEKDIKNFKEDLEKCFEKQKKNEIEISKLKEENEKLKKSKEPNISKVDKSFDNFINNLKGLSIILGLNMMEKNSNENVEEDKKKKEDKNIEKKIDKKIIDKKKEEYEKQFKELKIKSNKFNGVLQEQNEIINEYKDYLNEVNKYINTFKEKINISVINNVIFDIDNNNKKYDEINKQVDKVSIILVELDEIIFKIKNTFWQNIENLLNEIQTNLNNLDKNENQNEYDFNNISAQIQQKIDEIKKIFEDFEKKKDNFYNKNHNVEEEMNKLKYLHRQFAKEYKMKRSVKSNINNNINNNNNQNNQNNNNQSNNNYNNNNNNINIENNIYPKKNIDQSFLFSIKDRKSKINLYKTLNLFKENEQDLLEMYLDEAQLLRKNYHILCYIYDDYDIYEIYYDLKGVGLEDYQFFSKCTHSFRYDKKIEIQSFLIDGNPSRYKMLDHGIEFNIKLKNYETIKIHMVYKAIKDLSRLCADEIEERSIYRSDYYGLDRSLAGQMAKFSLILKVALIL